MKCFPALKCAGNHNNIHNLLIYPILFPFFAHQTTKLFIIIMSDSSLGLFKSVMVVSVTAAATLSVFGIFWTVQRATAETKTRRAKYTCRCGNVEASIIIPAANYRYSEIPSFQCACHDCVSFCNKVREQSMKKDDDDDIDDIGS